MARMRYDASVDALAIELTEGATSARTVKVTESVRLDFDTKGRLITIELLDASFHMDPTALAQLPTAQVLLTLREAEAESGLAASTLRVQLNAGRIKGVKRGRDWYVDATDLMNYLESRSARGRPAESGPRRGMSSRVLEPMGRSVFTPKDSAKTLRPKDGPARKARSVVKRSRRNAAK